MLVNNQKYTAFLLLWFFFLKNSGKILNFLTKHENLFTLLILIHIKRKLMNSDRSIKPVLRSLDICYRNFFIKIIWQIRSGLTVSGETKVSDHYQNIRRLSDKIVEIMRDPNQQSNQVILGCKRARYRLRYCSG